MDATSELVRVLRELNSVAGSSTRLLKAVLIYLGHSRQVGLKVMNQCRSELFVPKVFKLTLGR